MYKKGKYTVIENKEIAKDTFSMILEGDVSAIKAPGQFINIEIERFYLRRPISICDLDNSTIKIIYKVVGSGTREMSYIKQGEVLDILTGLGNGFSIKEGVKDPIVIGGGIGVPPMYALAKFLIKHGITPRVVLGFSCKENIVLEEEFKALGCDVKVTTIDGSYGIKGNVLEALKDFSDYDYFYACGSRDMLKAVSDSTICSGQLSFEERMGCGFGSCLGCSCKTNTGEKRICKEGPVLFKEDVIW